MVLSWNGNGSDMESMYITDLILKALVMLTGEEGVDWEHHRIPLAWWQACLHTIRN